MTAVTVRYMDFGDTSDGEQLSARWSDLQPDIAPVTPRSSSC